MDEDWIYKVTAAMQKNASPPQDVKFGRENCLGKVVAGV